MTADRLSGADKEKADRLAAYYSATVFGKAMDQLTTAQVVAVNNRVKSHFVS